MVVRRQMVKSPLKGCKCKPTMGCDAERKKNICIYISRRDRQCKQNYVSRILTIVYPVAVHHDV